MGKIKAIYLDRDGTIVYDVGYPRRPEQVQLLPGVLETLIKLKGFGFVLVMISNQSGVGRGIICPEEAESVHQKVLADLEAQGLIDKACQSNAGAIREMIDRMKAKAGQ